MTHHLKCWPEYFAPVADGRKPWELRKDDRPYSVGDWLHLQEWIPDDRRNPRAKDGFTGHEVYRRVTYVARGGLIPEGYCIMSLAT